VDSVFEQALIHRKVLCAWWGMVSFGKDPEGRRSIIRRGSRGRLGEEILNGTVLFSTDFVSRSRNIMS
jgi:hypothetical protein